jgi:hypothetical protein
MAKGVGPILVMPTYVTTDILRHQSKSKEKRKAPRLEVLKNRSMRRESIAVHIFPTRKKMHT